MNPRVCWEGVLLGRTWKLWAPSPPSWPQVMTVFQFWSCSLHNNTSPKHDTFWSSTSCGSEMSNPRGRSWEPQVGISQAVKQANWGPHLQLVILWDWALPLGGLLSVSEWLWIAGHPGGGRELEIVGRGHHARVPDLNLGHGFTGVDKTCPGVYLKYVPFIWC